MANVDVPAPWYAQGRLPPICARHGRPATRGVQRSFHTATPPWVWLLVLVSLLIAAIVAAVMRKTVTGLLPACGQCVSERRRFLGSVAGAWVLAVGLLVVAALLADGVLAALGLVLAFAALVGTFCGDLVRVRGTLRSDQAWIILKNVSPAFAAEMQHGLQQAAAAHARQMQPAIAYGQPVPYGQPAAYGQPMPYGQPSTPAQPGTTAGRDILPGR